MNDVFRIMYFAPINDFCHVSKQGRGDCIMVGYLASCYFPKDYFSVVERCIFCHYLVKIQFTG